MTFYDSPMCLTIKSPLFSTIQNTYFCNQFLINFFSSGALQTQLCLCLLACSLSGIRSCSVTAGKAFRAASVWSVSFPLLSKLPKERIHIIRSTLLVNMLIMMSLLINRLMIMARKYSAVRCSSERMPAYLLWANLIYGFMKQISL